jgi:hypothetical protein
VQLFIAFAQDLRRRPRRVIRVARLRALKFRSISSTAALSLGDESR